VTWVFFDRNERLWIARRAGVSDVGTVADLVLTVRTDARIVDASRGEHPGVSFGDERTAVLAFRHSSSNYYLAINRL